MKWDDWVDESRKEGDYLLLSKSGKVMAGLRSCAVALLGTPGAEQTQQLLAEIHNREYHLSCSCSNEQRSHICIHGTSNTRFWRINRSSAAHETSCPLYFEYKLLQIVKKYKPLSTVKPLNFFPATSEITQNAEDRARSSKTRTVGLSKLSRLLIRILIDSDWTTYTQNKAFRYQAAIDTIRKLDLDLVSGVKLADFFTCRYDFIGQKLKKLSSLRRWPKNQERYLISMLCVDHINDKTMIIERSGVGRGNIEITVQATLKNATGGFGNESGPYLALIIFRDSDEGFCAYSASYYPIWSKFKWLPVDSNNERNTLFSLVKEISYVYNKQKGHLDQVVINKPLVSVIEDEPGLIPDFLITDNATGKTIAVEVNGFGDDQYLNHKREQLIRAREIYTDGYALDLTSNTKEAVTTRIKQQRRIAYQLIETK